MVRQLIQFVKMKEGADVATSYVNSVNEHGCSALHYAAEVVDIEKNALEANREVVKLLLENGIDVTLATKAVNDHLFKSQQSAFFKEFRYSNIYNIFPNRSSLSVVVLTEMCVLDT